MWVSAISPNCLKISSQLTTDKGRLTTDIAKNYTHALFLYYTITYSILDIYINLGKYNVKYINFMAIKRFK